VFVRRVRRLLFTINVVSSSPIVVTVIMHALISFETSVLTRSTPRIIPEDDILHSHRRELLKSYNEWRSFTSFPPTRFLVVVQAPTCLYRNGATCRAIVPFRPSHGCATRRHQMPRTNEAHFLMILADGAFAPFLLLAVINISRGAVKY
jgi:hypothetical protein